MFNIDRNEFFRQVTNRICGSLDIEKALGDSLAYIRDFIPSDSMVLGLYDPVMNIGQIVASAGRITEKHLGRIVPMPREGMEFTAARWASMGPVEIVNRPDMDHASMIETYRIFDIDPHISKINIRLELEGNRIGVLLVIAEGLDRYSDEHAKLARMLHDPFAIAMMNALRYQEVLGLKDMLADDNRYLQRSLREMTGEKIVGAEFGLREVVEMAESVSSLDSPVLLYGETGVGKEVVANMIHCSSPRKNGPFIRVNCGAIPESLIDSELFGHEKGAFTGAISQKRGRFERADKGTIFLDEVGELPLHAQVRFLNVLQNREIERVGGTRTVPVDIRVISATHRDLKNMTRTGEFREDLWFRLNVFPITIPPLRKRKGDIPALVHYFIERKSMELKMGNIPVISQGSMEKLKAYDWPGNVRELQNIVERALIRTKDGVLEFDDVDLRRNAEDGVPSGEKNGGILTLNELNAAHIRKALDLSRGRINGAHGAAALLGINPNTLRKRMNKLGISYGRIRRAFGVDGGDKRI